MIIGILVSFRDFVVRKMVFFEMIMLLRLIVIGLFRWNVLIDVVIVVICVFECW